jgi:protein involved in polysaccharide export with SLBB domain
MSMKKLARFGTVQSVLLLFAAQALVAQQRDSAGIRAAQAHPQPGDRIFIHVSREPGLTDTALVNERGETAFPKLGIMRVSDLTISALKDSLRTLYSNYLRNPALQIVVLRRVVVNGEVRWPNVYLVDVSSTVSDLIAKAGGFTEASNRSKITIVRGGQRIPVRGWDRGGAAASELRSGDEVLVARRNWLALNILPALSTSAILVSLLVTLTR